MKFLNPINPKTKKTKPKKQRSPNEVASSQNPSLPQALTAALKLNWFGEIPSCYFRVLGLEI